MKQSKAILSLNLHQIDGFILLSEEINKAVRDFANKNDEITLILPSQSAATTSFTIDSKSFGSGEGMFNIRDIDDATFYILYHQFNGRFGKTTILEKFVLQLA